MSNTTELVLLLQLVSAGLVYRIQIYFIMFKFSFPGAISCAILRCLILIRYVHFNIIRFNHNSTAVLKCIYQSSFVGAIYVEVGHLRLIGIKVFGLTRIIQRNTALRNKKMEYCQLIWKSYNFDIGEHEIGEAS